MTTRLLAGLMWILLLWSGPSAAQSELRAGQQYAAGTAVQSTDMGIALKLPKEWLGTYRQKGGQAVLVLGSNTMEGVGMVLFLRDHSVERLKAMLEDVQDLGDNVVLRPDGAAKTESGRLSIRYLEARYVGRALALPGPQQNPVVFFFAGPKKNEAHYAELLQGLAASTQYAKARAAEPAPQAAGWSAKWDQFLAGMMLKHFSRYNSGGGGGGMSSEQVLHLCADHSFAYFGSSSLGMYVPGATAGGGDTNRSTGRWQVASADQNSAVLLVSADGGGEMRLDIRYDGEKTFVGNERWFRVESDGCR